MTTPAERLESVMGLLVTIANRYANSHADRDDLVQAGCLAVLTALPRYDPELGPFSNFAAVQAKGGMRRYLRDHSWGIRPPRRIQETAYAIRQVEDEMEQALGHRPTDAELAAELGCTPSLVAQARAASALAWLLPSIDAPALYETAIENADPDPRIEDASLLRSLPWHRLTPTERQVIWRYHVVGERQREIAADLGLTQMAVSRLIQVGLAKLRKAVAA